jgi:membrane-bound lytic murein transglycosylase A
MRWTVPSGGAALIVVAGLLAGCADSASRPPEKKVPMAPISFNEIPGWTDDKHAEALAAFRHSCPKLVAGPESKIVTDGGEKVVTAGEWKEICDSAARIRAADGPAAKRFFEENFRPLVVQVPARFTGYFEPELRGSRAP